MSTCSRWMRRRGRASSDIRELIDGVRYRADASARFKIYIIDEVHMLSTPAFNALLKTLEEPPKHVEIHLRHDRDPQDPGHRAVALSAVRPEAGRYGRDARHFRRHRRRRKRPRSSRRRWRSISRAADGSVRDGLSLLDQAIAHGAGQVERGTGARHAGPGRPRPRLRSVRRGDEAAISPPALDNWPSNMRWAPIRRWSCRICWN